MKSSKNLHSKRLVLLFWILVLIFYVYLSYDYLRVEMTDDKFAEALQHVVQVGGSESRTSKEIRTLVLVRADELGLPIRAEHVTIKGIGNTLNVTVGYDIDIDIPIFRQGFYTKRYEHQIKYRQGY